MLLRITLFWVCYKDIQEHHFHLEKSQENEKALSEDLHLFY